MSKPLAPLSLDLDNKWSYLKTHGGDAWRSYPSYLDILVPRVLDFLDERHLRITFFIVGRDADLSRHRDVLAEIARRGHEIANHSFNHEPWLHLYSHSDLEAEFDRSEEAIEKVTGVRPLGFRGPGFSLSNAVIGQLAKRGYQYDATVFPNSLNPLGRAYYFWKSDLTSEEKEQRKELFGTFSTALRPNKPFAWDVDGRRLPEIPVTTFPLLRTPIHLSYLTYLGSKAQWVARLYQWLSVGALRSTGNSQSMLLHPLDFLGADDEDELGFFPGMDKPSGLKLDLADRFIRSLERKFQLVPVAEYVEALDSLKTRRPDYGD